MKFLVPLILASLLVACAAPEDPATAHQRKLYEEARANFLALKAQERKGSAPMASARPAPTPATPAPTLLAKLFPPTKPTPAAKPAPLAKRTSKPTSRADETLYFTPTRLAKSAPSRKPAPLAKPTPTPTPKPTFLARLSQSVRPTPPANPTRPAKSAQPTKPVALTKPAAPPTTGRRPLWRKTAQQAPDTIYESNSNIRAEQQAWNLRQAEKYRAYEAREAHRLGKKPAQLTSGERAWIRARFE
jgi:outer membrane biosynthesis protein TonB